MFNLLKSFGSSCSFHFTSLVCLISCLLRFHLPGFMFGEIFIQSLNYYSQDTTRTEAIPTCVLYQKIVEAEDRGLQRVQQHWVPAWVVNQQHHLATIPGPKTVSCCVPSRSWSGWEPGKQDVDVSGEHIVVNHGKS